MCASVAAFIPGSQRAYESPNPQREVSLSALGQRGQRSGVLQPCCGLVYSLWGLHVHSTVLCSLHVITLISNKNCSMKLCSLLGTLKTI